jgi:hypothetical protein
MGKLAGGSPLRGDPLSISGAGAALMMQISAIRF